MNALKHGILARETLVVAGEGQEDAALFAALGDALRKELAPAGTMEGLLVDQIIALVWRLRRVLRFENAAIRMLADTATHDWEEAEKQRRDLFPSLVTEGEMLWQSTEALETQLDGLRESFAALDRPEPLYTQPTLWSPLLALSEDRYDVSVEEVLGLDEDESWEDLDEFEPSQVEKVVAAVCTAAAITEAELRQELRQTLRRTFEETERRAARRRLALERQRLLASLPDDASLAKVQRYEAHLSRHFYRALHELQRLQAARLGQRPTLPIALDVDISATEGEES